MTVKHVPSYISLNKKSIGLHILWDSLHLGQLQQVLIPHLHPWWWEFMLVEKKNDEIL